MKKEKKKGAGWLAALKTLGILLALLLCAALVFTIIPMTEGVDKTPIVGTADWMDALDDDLTLDAIVLPGTHDSGTQHVQLGYFSKCQGLDIVGQLAAGYRYLDIRLAVDGEQLRLMHGFTSCRVGAMPWEKNLTLDTVLEQCYAFLKEHPSETIVFAVKQEHGDESVADFEKLLNRYTAKKPSAWLLTDELPTLGQARGKLVLMRRYDDAAKLGKKAGIPLLWADQGGNEDLTQSIVSSDNGSYTLWVQDRFEYETEPKWEAFLEGLQEPGIVPGELAIHFLSTKGSAAYGHPWRYAQILDQRLYGRDSAQLSGWIVVDFGSARLAEHIYEANFAK